MTATFASKDWAERLSDRLQESARVRTESMSWIYGPLTLVVDADAEAGLEATALQLDLHEGSVRSVAVVEPANAARSPFAIGGSLARWKAALGGGGLSLVDGVLESKLRVRGDLPTLTRHRALLEAIAGAAAEVETTWPGDDAAA